MIETIFAEGLIDNAARMGRYFTEAAWALRDPWIGDVRFTGLLGGIELVRNRDTREILSKADVGKVKDHLHAQGMLITVSGLHGNVLRLQPPLTITSQQLDQFIGALRNSLRTIRGS
jgi:4-aminobutyrate aminotransferase-like enzyme